jgi:hypothetical protein
MARSTFRRFSYPLALQTDQNDRREGVRETDDQRVAVLPYSRFFSRPVSLVADLGRLAPASRPRSVPRVSSPRKQCIADSELTRRP